jgi:hypothetical protein
MEVRLRLSLWMNRRESVPFSRFKDLIMLLGRRWLREYSDIGVGIDFDQRKEKEQYCGI